LNSKEASMQQCIPVHSWQFSRHKTNATPATAGMLGRYRLRKKKKKRKKEILLLVAVHVLGKNFD